MSEQEEPARRETFVEHPAVYAAVGASAAADLMRFPPEGSSPFEDQLKLGSGADRFLAATSILMTWGAQRAMGIEVADVQHGGEDHYAGVVFGTDGAPEPSPDADVRYGPDGEAFLTAGTTAKLSWPDGKTVRNVRVVYVTDEARVSGFAFGTTDDDSVIGEVAFLVEHREDDSVWAVARGFFWAPTSGLFGLKARAAIQLAVKDAVQQLSALAPGAAAKSESDTAEQADPDLASPTEAE